MTQRRNNPDALTNYFDHLLRGIGHRGSSFTDLDRLDVRPVKTIAHDGRTHRFLLQEFKHEDEEANRGQTWMLEDLSRVPEFTVWFVVKRHDGRIAWFDVSTVAQSTVMDIITEHEYQERFRCWWNELPIPRTTSTSQDEIDTPRAVSLELTADDIPWRAE